MGDGSDATDAAAARSARRRLLAGDRVAEAVGAGDRVVRALEGWARRLPGCWRGIGRWRRWERGIGWCGGWRGGHDDGRAAGGGSGSGGGGSMGSGGEGAGGVGTTTAGLLVGDRAVEAVGAGDRVVWGLEGWATPRQLGRRDGRRHGCWGSLMGDDAEAMPLMLAGPVGA